MKDTKSQTGVRSFPAKIHQNYALIIAPTESNWSSFLKEAIKII